MKNNTAESVLLSPEEYVSLMDEVNDARLLNIAAERITQYKPESMLSEAELKKKLGITDEELYEY